MCLYGISGFWFPEGQHYKVDVGAHCHKSVPDLIMTIDVAVDNLDARESCALSIRPPRPVRELVCQAGGSFLEEGAPPPLVLNDQVTLNPHIDRKKGMAFLNGCAHDSWFEVGCGWIPGLKLGVVGVRWSLSVTSGDAPIRHLLSSNWKW